MDSTLISLIWLVIAATVVVLGWRYGADSRDGRDWASPSREVDSRRRLYPGGARPTARGDALLVFHWLGRAVPTGQPPGGGGGRTLPWRLVQLFIGLIGFGVSIAFMVRARLGLGPWDVLHQGLAERTGFEIGSINIAVSVIVLMLWIPLRQRPRVGTVANVIVVGLAVNLALVVLPSPGPLWLRAVFLVVGIVATGVATGLYIGAGLGPGPRDGLMTGLAERGHSIRVVRTGIELSVLLIGWLLGGAVGVGTVLFAVGIGPLAHYFIPKLRMASPAVGDAPGHSGSVVPPTAPTSSSSQISQRTPRLRRSRRTPGSGCTPTAAPRGHT